MGKALLLGIAALMLLGCGAVNHKGKVVSKSQSAYGASSSVASGGSTASMVAKADASPQYVARKKYRPSDHEMAVHKFHQKQRANARNNEYWTVKKLVNNRREREAKEMIEKRKQAVAVGALGEVAQNANLTEKKKKDAIRKLEAKRTAVMNAMGDMVAFTKNRLDLKPNRLNSNRMPGNGMVGIQANDRYISRQECGGNMKCVNSAATSKARMKQLGNTLDR